MDTQVIKNNCFCFHQKKRTGIKYLLIVWWLDICDITMSLKFCNCTYLNLNRGLSSLAPTDANIKHVITVKSSCTFISVFPRGSSPAVGPVCSWARREDRRMLQPEGWDHQSSPSDNSTSKTHQNRELNYLPLNAYHIF